MTIYYIAVSGWNGSAYTFSYNRLFLTEQERDKALVKMKEGKSFKEADIILDTGKNEVEDALKAEE